MSSGNFIILCSVANLSFFDVHVNVHSDTFLTVNQLDALISQIRMEFHPDPARKLSANLYDTYHCSVYSKKLMVMDRGTVRNM